MAEPVVATTVTAIGGFAHLHQHDHVPEEVAALRGYSSSELFCHGCGGALRVHYGVGGPGDTEKLADFQAHFAEEHGAHGDAAGPCDGLAVHDGALLVNLRTAILRS